MRFGNSKTYRNALNDARKARKKSLIGVFIGAIGMGASFLFTINRAEEYGHARMFEAVTGALEDVDTDDDIDE